MMREILEANGYSVAVACDGKDALEQLDHLTGVCLILLDLVMPVMNGWDFYAQLQAQPAFAQVPVVVQSSTTAKAPAGVTRVLQKPVGYTRLLSVVHELCAA